MRLLSSLVGSKKAALPPDEESALEELAAAVSAETLQVRAHLPRRSGGQRSARGATPARRLQRRQPLLHAPAHTQALADTWELPAGADPGAGLADAAVRRLLQRFLRAEKVGWQHWGAGVGGGMCECVCGGGGGGGGGGGAVTGRRMRRPLLTPPPPLPPRS